MGAGGFEPPKLKAADLQSVPIGHSGTRPYSFLCVRSPDDLLILAWEMDFVNCFLLFSSKVFLRPSKAGCGNVDGFVRKRRISVFFAAKNICRISGRSGGSGLHSAQFYVIISDELNRKQQVPSAALRGGKGKREAGADPARSRHCDKGVRVRVLCAPATGALFREGGAGRRSFSQETCLLLVRGPEPQITRNWLYQKALKKSEVFLSCHPQDKRASFLPHFPVPLFGSAAIYPQERTRQ